MPTGCCQQVLDAALTGLTLDDAALKENEKTHTWRCRTGCCQQALNAALTELTLDAALDAALTELPLDTAVKEYEVVVTCGALNQGEQPLEGGGPAGESGGNQGEQPAMVVALSVSPLFQYEYTAPNNCDWRWTDSASSQFSFPVDLVDLLCFAFLACPVLLRFKGKCFVQSYYGLPRDQGVNRSHCLMHHGLP